MKSQENKKIEFKKESVVELNGIQLRNINGGSEPVITPVRTTRFCKSVFGHNDGN